MFQVSEKEVKIRLQFDNPWWEIGGNIDSNIKKYKRRYYFQSFYQLVSDQSINRATILMGPRRVGKTIMVYHAIHELLESNISGQRILYLSLETPVYTGLSLEQLVNTFISHFNYSRTDKIFIFFDEIQYLKDWEIHLKSLVDSYPDFQFVATGSAAAVLRLKSRESGAGRFTDFLLPPLTFAEYIHFIDHEEELIEKFTTYQEDEGIEAIEYKAKNIDELNNEFMKYLNYGGYPEAVYSSTIQSDSTRFIKSDIIDKVLLRDLPSLYGISDIQELNRLFTTVAYNTGNEVSLEGLSKTSGVAKNTLKKYLEYLEGAFLIKRVHRIDQNAKRFKRATYFKVYLTNPSMRAALFGFLNESDEAMGSLTETAIFSQWLHSSGIDLLHYARWKKGEVDIVSLSNKEQKPQWCVEVKWSDLPVKDARLSDNVVKFCIANDLNEALVTTKTKYSTKEISNIQITYRPAAEHTYILGTNILKSKF